MIRLLSRKDAEPLLARQSTRLVEAEEAVKPILDAVKSRGDAALREYAERFDGFNGADFRVGEADLRAAVARITPDFRRAIEASLANIEAFAKAQMPREFTSDLGHGHLVGQIVRPLDRVACYIPGGRYPLPSTILMTAGPARVAGVKEIWVTTPKPNPETFAAAMLAGVNNVSLVGGAHAIAAFAFGTESIPKADRIVGPGNIYVAAAKKLLAGDVGIDFVAGPTEVLIIANEGNPRWVAADMLAQAEHDPDAAALLVTTSREFGIQVADEIERQLSTLATEATARKAIENNSAVIVVSSDDEAIELANEVAPEHLCLHNAKLLSKVRHAGSVFLGANSPEAAGDYSSGPNHVLPTAGAARLHGGLSVTHFLKVITTQELSRDALKAISQSAVTLARAEGLEAHARSIEVRLNA